MTSNPTPRFPLPTHRQGEDVPSKSSAWLAAYALGLAHTTSRDRAVRELRETAGGHPGLLREASRHLASLDDLDADLRARTHALLVDAVDACDATVAETG